MRLGQGCTVGIRLGLVMGGDIGGVLVELVADHGRRIAAIKRLLCHGRLLAEGEMGHCFQARVVRSDRGEVEEEGSPMKSHVHFGLPQSNDNLELPLHRALTLA
ncbi:MAG: hypothetical protein BWY79_02184 [Actinobacteria bacterium ADurb.Bin444]|nr:MAG: hypothetical protein BWY79_02184 [Actinobacteria bacterium ADurb.Bin444]